MSVSLQTPGRARDIRDTKFRAVLENTMCAFNGLVTEPFNVGGGWQMTVENKGLHVAVIDELMTRAKEVGWRIERHGNTLCIREPENFQP